jgi:hypothetical protein
LIILRSVINTVTEVGIITKNPNEKIALKVRNPDPAIRSLIKPIRKAISTGIR